MAEMEHPAFFEATVPKGAFPGQRFDAFRPDGERVQAFVPEDAAPGDVIQVPWDAAPASPTAVVIGLPIGRAGVGAADLLDGDLELGSVTGKANKAADFGWAMYGIGWCVCCFFGPLGLIFWFCTCLTHYLRPKETRGNFPRERFIAKLSCFTGLSALIVHVILVGVVFSIYSHGLSSCSELYATPVCTATPAAGLWPGTVLAVDCPAVCAQAACYGLLVWGGAGGVYARGSAICGSALQAGIIAEGVGGEVLVEIAGGEPVYFGIKANGVVSQTVDGPTEGFLVLPADGADANASSLNGTVTGPYLQPLPLGTGDENATVATPHPATSAATTRAPPGETTASSASTAPAF